MSVELAVDLYGTRLGTFRGADWRSADIDVEPQALERWGVNAPILSVAAPLELRPRRARAARRRNVLGELLPEGPTRERLARLAGVSTHDIPGLLARFGRDVAGAVDVCDPRSPWEPPRPRLRPADDALIARRLDEDRLGNDPATGKTSLAGVQPKIVLARVDGAWFQPEGGALSTHIVKPALPGRPEALAEEEYGHRLAAALGLGDFSVDLRRLGGRDCLVIERYDRVAGRRLHQEDFNQALGLAGDAKYQEVGGHARLTRVAEIVRRHCPNDLDRLVAQVTLAVAIGNLDLHAKNIGLLHPPDGSVALAPAYDMVPLAHVPHADGRLAMAVDGEYAIAAMSRDRLDAEVTAWGAGVDGVRATLRRLLEVVDEEGPLAGAEPVRDRIATAVERLLSGRSIGDAFS